MFRGLNCSSSKVFVDIDKEILKFAQKGPKIINSLEKEGRVIPTVPSAPCVCMTPDSARSGAHSGSTVASPVGGWPTSSLVWVATAAEGSRPVLDRSTWFSE